MVKQNFLLRFFQLFFFLSTGRTSSNHFVYLSKKKGKIYINRQKNELRTDDDVATPQQAK